MSYSIFTEIIHGENPFLVKAKMIKGHDIYEQFGTGTSIMNAEDVAVLRVMELGDVGECQDERVDVG